MSRLTEAVEKQGQLDTLTGEDFKAATDKAGFAPLNELKHQHYNVIDYLLENPRISSQDLADKADYSLVYIKKLRRTPLFIIALEEAVSSAHASFRGNLISEVAQCTMDALRALSGVMLDEKTSPREKTTAAKLVLEGDAFSLFHSAKVDSDSTPTSVNVNVNTPPDNGLGVTKEMLVQANKDRLAKYTIGDIEDADMSTSSE